MVRKTPQTSTVKLYLDSTHPKIAATAYGWDPSTLTYGSNKVRDWICDRRHVYPATPNFRTSGGNCCYCSGQRVLKGFNDLATTHPEIAATAHGWDPTTVTYGSEQVKDWVCSLQHVYESQVNCRVKEKQCPYCANRKVLAGFNDLATTHPEVATMAYGWDSTTVTYGTDGIRNWICELGHVTDTTIAARIRGKDCAYCANRKVLIGFNDLATTHPEIAATAYEWDPTTVTYGARKILNWICELGHIWPARVSSRSSGSGCSYCSGHKILVGFNDLATTHPEIAGTAYGWDPTTVTAGSHTIKEWQCTLGHPWKTSVLHRTMGWGCSFCSGHKILVGFNDLATTHPEVAGTAYGWDPTTVTAGSSKIKQWICPLKHFWSVNVSARTRGNGCPYCAGQKVWKGFNDLVTTHPEIAVTAHRWDPTTVTAGSEKRRKWICDKKHVWTALVSNRTGGTGCPKCARYGFNATKHAFLYLLIDKINGEQVLQFGITGDLKARLATHKRTGFRSAPVGLLEFPIGQDARNLERLLLEAMTHHKIPSCYKQSTRFDGSTESFFQSAVTEAFWIDFLSLIEITISFRRDESYVP